MITREEFVEKTLASRKTQYSIAWSILKNETDSCDAMQEALLKAWESRHKLRDDKLFTTWMTRILINECKMICRKRSRVFPVPEICAIEDPKQFGDESVQQAIDSLPEKQRLPVVLHYVGGYPQKEIATILSIPLNTVKSRLLQARHKLKIELESEERR